MTASVAIFHDSSYLLRALRDRITQRQTELASHVAAGLASDYEDYKYRIGVLQGMDEVMLIIDEMEKNERN